MKFVITENQFKSLVMEVDEKDLQKVSNYITRAVRTKFPVVDEIDLQSYFSPEQIVKSPNRGPYVKVYIFVENQLERSHGRRSPLANEITEQVILSYIKNLLEKFFGLKIMKASFDSDKFEYQGGEWT
jgi:hypothetical protein